jgi:hypothetical protein
MGHTNLAWFLEMRIISQVSYVPITSNKQLKSVTKMQFFFFLYCCAGWGYIVALTKVHIVGIKDPPLSKTNPAETEKILQPISFD